MVKPIRKTTTIKKNGAKRTTVKTYINHRNGPKKATKKAVKQEVKHLVKKDVHKEVKREIHKKKRKMLKKHHRSSIIPEFTTGWMHGMPQTEKVMDIVGGADGETRLQLPINIGLASMYPRGSRQALAYSKYKFPNNGLIYWINPKVVESSTAATTFGDFGMAHQPRTGEVVPTYADLETLGNKNLTIPIANTMSLGGGYKTKNHIIVRHDNNTKEFFIRVDDTDPKWATEPDLFDYGDLVIIHNMGSAYSGKIIGELMVTYQPMFKDQQSLYSTLNTTFADHYRSTFTSPSLPSANIGTTAPGSNLGSTIISAGTNAINIQPGRTGKFRISLLIGGNTFVAGTNPAFVPLADCSLLPSYFSGLTLSQLQFLGVISDASNGSAQFSSHNSIRLEAAVTFSAKDGVITLNLPTTVATSGSNWMDILIEQIPTSTYTVNLHDEEKLVSYNNHQISAQAEVINELSDKLASLTKKFEQVFVERKDESDDEFVKPLNLPPPINIPVRRQ